MDILVSEYISDQLTQLTYKYKCCVYWFGPFCNLEHITPYQFNCLGLKAQVHVINGHPVMKVFKSTCNHTIRQPRTLQLTDQSQRDILYHFQKCDYNAYHQNTMISPQVFRPARQKPILPPNRFTIGPARRTVFQCNGDGAPITKDVWRILPFKQEILTKIANNRVLVINGDDSLEKSIAIPMFVVDDATATGRYCKILCVVADNLSAITHCTVLTKYINERVGSRVGFQVYLQSRVCDNTNLIYTTSVFFLRVLMGQLPTESFLHISHIVISDIHLHHAYTELLMQEIKSILPHYPQIKIILLSNSVKNQSILSYFGEGEEMRLDAALNTVKLHYIEEIDCMLEHAQSRLKTGLKSNYKQSEECAEKSLEEYEKTGGDWALNDFLHFVCRENISIDFTHSKLGFTVLIAAAKHGNALHLTRLLSQENANPFIQDQDKMTALEYACSKNYMDCAKLLSDFIKENFYGHKPPPVDFARIEHLVQTITTAWKFGHILIFLPSYEDLLKLSFGILKLQFTGRIPQEICIYLLHPNMQFEQLQPIIAESVHVKIILSTNYAESLSYLSDITYVIDSSVNYVEKYNHESASKESTYEWISKESLQRRSTIASRLTAGSCFRLISKKQFDNLPSFSSPELLYMSLNRILLTVKLLCPHKSVSEYLEKTIVKPAPANVSKSVEFLKKIEIFDCTEDVTWLGCRLIDVPIDLELGKSLVLSILLKCLDPVLTITSFLTCSDPMEIERCIQHKKKKTPFLSENSYSDHLILLRLYQEWQNDKRENIANHVYSDLGTYVVHGILDKVCAIRTHLVGALRSSQLIHNQGQLSMHSINSKANNWAVIKAALAGGLYPKLCMIDKYANQLISRSSKLCIHTSSVLSAPNNALYQNYPSDWITFFRETNNIIVNSISNCMLIGPVAIALFVGNSKLEAANIYFPNKFQSSKSNSEHASFSIDEWICIPTDVNSALLLFKLRQRFFTLYLDFLQTCGNSDKWRKSTESSEISRVFDLIAKILLEEDINLGFSQPNRVGNRPKAVVNKFTSDFIDVHPRLFAMQRRNDLKNSVLIRYHCLEKEFFLVNIFDSNENVKSMWKMSVLDVSKNSVLASIGVNASTKKLIYIIVCNVNRKQLTNIALVKHINGEFDLRNCFQINIPVFEIVIMCKMHKLNLPQFRPDLEPMKLDSNVGEIILDLL